VDNLPRIDRAPGFVSVNGLYRHGYLLSPYVLDLALQVCEGRVAHPIVHDLPQAKMVGAS
jgi:hypothetical protein